MSALPTSNRYYFPSLSSTSLLAHLPIVLVIASCELLALAMSAAYLLLRRAWWKLTQETRLRVPLYAVLVGCHTVLAVASPLFRLVMARTRGWFGIFLTHYIFSTIVVACVLYVIEAWYILSAWIFYDVRSLFTRS